MTSIGATLLWCVIQVTAVAAASVAAYLLAFRGGATARGGVALAGLMTAAVLAPLAFSPWPRWEGPVSSPADPVTVSSPDAGGSTTAAYTTQSQGLPRPSAEPASVWPAAWAGFMQGLAEPELAPASAAVEPARSTIRWPILIAWLFAAAVAAGLLRLAVGAWAVRRSIRRAKPIYDPALFGLIDVLRAELSCPAKVELRESAEVATAATAGWRKPVLLLPPDWRGWTDDECRAVVAHELAHVKRRDYLATIAAQAALAVHFYHPLLHWLAGRVRLEQELAADALAASVSGGRSAYLRTLAELALRRSDGRVAWPARAFLPSRRTFLRRIEMLRDPRRAADRPAPLLRATAAAGLLLFGLVVAGIRPDLAAAQNPPAATADAKPASGAAAAAGTNETAPAGSAVVYIPSNAMFVATVRPQALLSDPAVKPFAAEIEKGISEAKDPVWIALRDAGVTPQTVESLAVGMTLRNNRRGAPELTAFVARLSKPVDRAAIEKAASEKTTTFGGIMYRLGNDARATIPDDNTLLLAQDEATLTAMLVGGHLNRTSSPWPRIEEKLGTPILAVLVDTETTVALLRADMPPGSPQLMMFAPVMPLLNDAKLAGVSLSTGEGPGLRGYAECDDESAAKRVGETLRALVTLGKNTLRQLKGQTGGPPDQQALAKMFLPMAEQLLNSAQIQSEGTGVTLTADAGGSAAIALGLVLPAVQKARESARRAQSQNNLKQIALAFHNYHDVNGHFPPAVIEENGVARSWRVEILPYLDQDALYRQYRKDQPWDSPDNKRVLEQMPLVYQDQGNPSGPTNASYFLLTGPAPIPATGKDEGPLAGLPAEQAAKSTIFSDKPVQAGKGPGLLSMVDGTSNTVLIVEAKRDVPWTKPEDIPFDAEKAGELLQQLGAGRGGFNAAFADGSVRFLSSGIDRNVFKSLLTPAGGELVGPEAFDVPSRQPAVLIESTPAPTKP
jgi:prepilin-type processing-associated H-X9-DG protein